LYKQGKHVEAVAAYREAIRLRPDFPEAHFKLGLALREEGRFRDALASLRQAHRLGSRRPRWPSGHSAAEVRRVERLVELDRDLPAFLAGRRQPAGPDEHIELAALCRHPAKRLYAAAARFWAAAFRATPALGDDLRASHRYNAACAAALAGCGQGEDAPRSDEQRARLRRRALRWLRADLAAWRRLREKGPAAARAAEKQLRHWRQDADLIGVRDKGPLARLTVEERLAWHKFWADVTDALAPATNESRLELPANEFRGR
jgi:tetratricopeptide (TPR) repeat protein